MNKALAFQRRDILPYLALAAGIIALGFSAMFVRWANVPGPVTGFYRNLFAIIILTPIALAKRRPITDRRTLIFPILGGLFTALDLSLWSIAVQTTTAGNATLLNNTAPLWVALIAWLVFRERLGRDFWLGLILSLAGAGLIAGIDLSSHTRLGLGDGIALISSLFYASYFLTTQYGRQRIGPLNYIWIVGLSTVAGLFIINRVMGNPLYGFDSYNWLVFLGYALIGQLVGYASLTYALGHLPASIVSPTMVGQPVLTIVLGIPLLNEVPGPLQLIGSLLVLVGIYLVHRTYNLSRQEAARETVAGLG
jgi:drug/metabolite transporter (DMT)-like permease